MNFSHRSITLQLMTLFICAAFPLSCDIPVEYRNPFEHGVTIPPPSELKIDSVNDTFISLSWRNNFSVSGQNQIPYMQTVISYNREGYYVDIYGSVQPIYPIDTVKGLASSATISRIFELIPGTGAAYLCVRTISGSNSSDPSAFVGTRISSPTPSQLTAALVNRTSCRLQWSDNSKSESYFAIERKISAVDSFALIATSPAHSVSFIDTTITYEGDTVYYRIRAVFENGVYSAYDSASVYVPIVAPSLASAPAVNSTSVSLSLTNNVAFGDGFIIERAEKNGSFIEIGRMPSTLHSYTDISPDTTKEYVYRVRLFAGTKISDPSNSVDLGFWPTPIYVRGIAGNYGKMAVSTDYSLIALTDYNGGDITIINYADLQTLKQFHNANLTAMSVDISTSNQYVAAGFMDLTQNTGSIKIFRFNDGSLYREWERSNPVDAVRFSPDGSLIAADGYSGATVHVPPIPDLPGSVSITDIKKDSVISTVYGNNVIAFSSNHAAIATGGVGFFEWNPLNGSLRGDLWPAVTYQLRFFNDGIRIVCGGTANIFVEGGSNTEISFPYFISSLDLTPDNKFLVVLGEYVPIVIKVDGWIVVSSTILKSDYSSILCLPNGRFILAGPSGLSEYQLENQWESPVSFN